MSHFHVLLMTLIQSLVLQFLFSFCIRISLTHVSFSSILKFAANQKFIFRVFFLLLHFIQSFSLFAFHHIPMFLVSQLFKYEEKKCHGRKALWKPTNMPAVSSVERSIRAIGQLSRNLNKEIQRAEVPRAFSTTAFKQCNLKKMLASLYLNKDGVIWLDLLQICTSPTFCRSQQ